MEDDISKTCYFDVSWGNQKSDLSKNSIRYPALGKLKYLFHVGEVVADGEQSLVGPLAPVGEGVHQGALVRHVLCGGANKTDGRADRQRGRTRKGGETDRQTGRQQQDSNTERHGQRKTEKQACRHTDTHRQRGRQTRRHINTGRQTDTKTGQKGTEKKRDQHTERDAQTYIQAGRRTDVIILIDTVTVSTITIIVLIVIIILIAVIAIGRVMLIFARITPKASLPLPPISISLFISSLSVPPIMISLSIVLIDTADIQ